MEKLSLYSISPIGVEASPIDLVILSEAKDLCIAEESEIPRFFAEFTLSEAERAQNDAFLSMATVETHL